MDIIDLNIFLAPSENIVAGYNQIEKSLKDMVGFSVEFESCPNVPHLSLYQLAVSADKISSMISELNAIETSLSPFKMNTNLNIKGTNVFWSSEAATFHKDLVLFHEQIVNRFKEFRATSPLRQIQENWAYLSDEKKHLVDQYGVFWGIPGYFDPHITVLYNFSDRQHLLPHIIDSILIPESTFTSYALGIAKIGFHGNIEETLFTKILL